MKLGITGHQRLKESDAWTWVLEQLNSILDNLQKPLIGVTSLAIGADQLFAKTILEQGGAIKAIIPFNGYEFTFEEETDREEYFRLLRRAGEVEVLVKTGSNEDAYFAAGKKVVDSSDILFAIWDGKPAAGLGGTGDVVEYATKIGKKVIHLNPVKKTVIDK